MLAVIADISAAKIRTHHALGRNIAVLRFSIRQSLECGAGTTLAWSSPLLCLGGRQSGG
jgi:hypothetical protein